jgi:hypothetical protein
MVVEDHTAIGTHGRDDASPAVQATPAARAARDRGPGTPDTPACPASATGTTTATSARGADRAHRARRAGASLRRRAALGAAGGAPGHAWSAHRARRGRAARRRPRRRRARLGCRGRHVEQRQCGVRDEGQLSIRDHVAALPVRPGPSGRPGVTVSPVNAVTSRLFRRRTTGSIRWPMPSGGWSRVPDERCGCPRWEEGFTAAAGGAPRPTPRACSASWS